MLILHHYPMSPFSEKIRLMLGYAGVPWQSLHSPEMPPRPNIDPLSGGYRRIPIAQIGADIFCDSRLISIEVTRLAQNNALNPVFIDDQLKPYAEQLETDVFWAAVLSMGAGTTIRQLLKKLGLWKTLRFLKDRAGVGKTAKVKAPSAQEATQIFSAHLEDLEQRLQADFLAGTAAGYLDFAAYHTLWFQLYVGEKAMPAGLPKVEAWYHRMQSFGHGTVEEITQEQAFTAARDGVPRKIRRFHTADPLIGKTVSVSPADYGLDAVEGMLVGSSPTRWILKRQTDDFGTLHVHFPKAGFELHVKD